MEKIKNIQNSLQIKPLPDLPILKKRDEIIEKVMNNSVVIISGETGSGKTTQIPKYLLQAGFGTKGIIGCTQPRRIAAINVALRIAEELGQKVGESIGYKIRFDDKSSKNCLIKIMTDGILLAETQKDRFLNQYEAIIVDEAHERSLNIDFTLGILRNLIKKRKDLKLIITSATIDTEKFSKAFDNAPVIEVSGRMFPVDVKYMQVQNEEDPADSKKEADDTEYIEATADAVDHILSEFPKGDILVFMPTEQDISETIELVRARQRDHRGLLVLPLFARLSSKDQQKIFSKGPLRKVIVSTNVAETSLTIPSIKYVIDTGLARIPSYSPRTRTTSLPVKKISKSSADQRMGRCGRVANGMCIRLFSEEDFHLRPFFTSPEIVRSNLAEVILRMISLKLGDVRKFPFIDSPSEKSIKDGFSTLLELGAIKEEKIFKHQKTQKIYSLTKIGKIMARIPVDPKLSRILIEADTRGCLNEAIIITSALAIADPRQRPREKAQQADQKHAQLNDPSSDFISYLNIWKTYKGAQKKLKSRSSLRKFCNDNFLSFRRLREWEDISRQIRNILTENSITGKKLAFNTGTKGLKSKENEVGSDIYTAIHKSLLSGYLTNIAHKKEKYIFNAAKGQQVMIFPGSGLFKSANVWIVAAQFIQTSKLFARCVANIDPAWVEEMGKDLCTYAWSSPHYEKNRGEVVANEQVALFGLILVGQRPVPYGKVNSSEAGDIFIRKALVEGELNREFSFMTYNNELIEKIQTLEGKTRKRGIVATEDDIFLFYKAKLKKDFFNLRTFSKYIKDKDDSFLRLTENDLIREQLDENELFKFPDTLEMGKSKFKLEYVFSPGSKNDGITVNVPAVSAPSISRYAIEQLVPGLFEEKIINLIKNLPKKYRTNLLPVSEKAAIIAKQMPKTDKPLFSLLSCFAKDRFNLNIPASAWSDKNLDQHLKMRISIRNEKDEEIEASRDNSLINKFYDNEFSNKGVLEKEKAKFERENLLAWDFEDIGEPIIIRQENNVAFNVFLGLAKENEKVSLRLYQSKQLFLNGHKKGILSLYMISYAEQFKALKKDIRSSKIINKHASFFNGAKEFQTKFFNAITRQFFLKDIRKKKEFLSYAQNVFPDLYNKTIEFLSIIDILIDEYKETDSYLQKLSFKAGNRIKVKELIQRLYNDFQSLVPKNFLELYEFERIENLHRYIKAISVRAERAFGDPIKDGKKAVPVDRFSKYLNTLLENLSSDTSSEKTEKIEEFFWMLEEYKISVFAQELKPIFKVSVKKLDDFVSQISKMV
ncbi:MAG: ATP-dependent RNA helicase HrpA [Desulfobacterales bacterium]|nr:ATP-dependent RNA helicase HrpA [Desulfobacterales bacterium]